MTNYANWQVQLHYFKNCIMADNAEMYMAEEMWRVSHSSIRRKRSIIAAFYVLL
jgi:hypothetical protein